MRRLLLIAGLLAAFAGNADVFRWVDENGQVHYSDRPREGAERIELREPQTFSAPVTRRPPRTPDNSAAGQEEPFRYETLEITSPAQEETLWNIEGQLEVSMRLSPRLRDSHELRIYADGQQIELQGGSTRVRLTEVYRGTHNLRAEVVDANGNSLIQSEPVTYYVRQTSIQNPRNPNVSRPTPLAR